ncbi:hypothetical protein G9F73_008675 [Clostridium estertheticum]|uniref:hypothetical protein n=1 Tax=Clostridium estertheticum TaxID=238834 RepID=UPI001CCB82BC|nr:hypothetical protein [Clostridium estertheticum]MBZ9607881.1 hypothetical protein [Clostridium estertheticum]
METNDKEKLIEFIQESGKSSKEFMGILMGDYELNKVKSENETVKTLLADSQARKIDLENKIISKDIDVDTLKIKLEVSAVEAQKEVTRISELKEFEKEKALLL